MVTMGGMISAGAGEVIVKAKQQQKQWEEKLFDRQAIEPGSRYKPKGTVANHSQK
jgi:hypothetical protein